jgi:hypothetical protein
MSERLNMRPLAWFGVLDTPRAEHEQHIEETARLGWYREHGIKPAFEMVRGRYGMSLRRELTFAIRVSRRWPVGAAYVDEPLTIKQVTAHDEGDDDS